jgi:hypothetical protein
MAVPKPQPWSSPLLADARQRVALALLPLAVLWAAVVWAARGVGPAAEIPAAAPPAPALQRIVGSGDPAPGGGSFDRFDVNGQAVTPSSNRAGQVAFFATLVRSRAEEGLFLATGERIERLAAVGDPVPGG